LQSKATKLAHFFPPL